VEFVYDIDDTTGPDLHEDLLQPFRATGRLNPIVLGERDGIASAIWSLAELWPVAYQKAYTCGFIDVFAAVE
jgi:hypothetical protein